MTEKWDGGIVVRLSNGSTWSADWTFTAKRGCSKPSRVLRAARRGMSEEKVRGRGRWLRYTISITLPK
jgi:hypothetical protein